MKDSIIVDISEDKQQLARATLPSLTCDCMKKQLKAIYNVSQENNLSIVKVELVFETRGYSGTNRQIDGYYRSNRGQNNSYYRGSQGRGRFGRGKANQNIHGSGGSIYNELRKRNPVNSYGKVTHCDICESIYHWAKECPHKESDPHNTPKLPFLLKRHRNVL